MPPLIIKYLTEFMGKLQPTVRTTHRFLIEPLSACLHPKVMLLSRFVKFHQNLVESPKFSVRYLARITENDMTTVMGNNLYSILKKCNLEGSQIDRLTPGFVKKKEY